MSEHIFNCPKCGKSLKAEVNPGDKVECSECANVFVFQPVVAKPVANCPYCGAEVDTQEDSWGDVKCPYCQKKFKPVKVVNARSIAADNTYSGSRIVSLTPSRGFGTLHILGAIVSVLGWIYMGLAIIGGIIVIAETDDPSGVVIIILGVIAGIIVVAMGQALTCFVSMERGIQDIKRELQSLNKG